MFNLPIRTRLIFLFTLQVTIFIVAGGFYLDWRLTQTLENELDDKILNLSELAANQIDSDLLLSLTPGDESTRTYRNLMSQIQTIQKKSGARRIYVFSKSRQAVLDTKPDVAIGAVYNFLPIAESELGDLFNGVHQISILFKGDDARLYKSGFASIYAGDEVVAALALEANAETLSSIRVVRRDLLILGLVILAGSILLAIYFSKRITTPIRRLKDAANRIAHGDYESKIARLGEDEIGFLAKTMEEMRRAIIQRDTAQKTMLAGVAHEIRNPLGGIELFAGLLADEVKEPSAKTEAEKIKKEVQNLKKIVNDFLDYARPQTANKENFVIIESVDKVKALLAHELEGIKVTISEEKIGTHLLADQLHFKQIFLNLFKNSIAAIKENGEIKIHINSSSGIKIIFSDNGCGIPVEMRPRIFEPFFTGSKDGTGLGLALVKSLVEANDCRIELIAGRNQGSAFLIRGCKDYVVQVANLKEITKFTNWHEFPFKKLAQFVVPLF